MMRAIGYRRHGDVRVLEHLEAPKPVARAGEVLVRVHAFGLNPLDYRLRQGELKLLTAFNMPRYVASDFAGTVAEVGPGVEGFSVNDSVFGMASQVVNGCAAQFIRISQDQIAKMPPTLGFEIAAGVPLASLTAYQALSDITRVHKGDRVLINGASGGVGTFATQMAYRKGALVTGVTSFRNTDMVSRLGAQHIVDYTQRDFAEENERFDLIFDCYGNRRFEQVERVLSTRGRYISTIPAWSRYTSVVFNPLRAKKSSVVVVRARGHQLAVIASMIEAGEITPIVEKVYESHQFVEAYTHLESKRAKGKITVKME